MVKVASSGEFPWEGGVTGLVLDFGLLSLAVYGLVSYLGASVLEWAQRAIFVPSWGWTQASTN